MIIKFKTPEEKTKKIAEAIKALEKLTTFNTSTSTGTTFTTTPAVWTVQSPYININTGLNGLTSGSITTTSNAVVGNSTSINNNNGLSAISKPTTSIFTQPTQTSINGNGTSITGTSITTGVANIGLGTIAPQTNISIGTTYNSYGVYSATKYSILGTDVEISFFHNGEVIISLINTLGVEFWDEYTIQSGIAISNPFAYAAIEEVMKLHRRDEKLNNILGE